MIRKEHLQAARGANTPCAWQRSNNSTAWQITRRRRLSGMKSALAANHLAEVNCLPCLSPVVFDTTQNCTTVASLGQGSVSAFGNYLPPQTASQWWEHRPRHYSMQYLGAQATGDADWPTQNYWPAWRRQAWDCCRRPSDRLTEVIPTPVRRSLAFRASKRHSKPEHLQSVSLQPIHPMGRRSDAGSSLGYSTGQFYGRTTWRTMETKARKVIGC